MIIDQDAKLFFEVHLERSMSTGIQLGDIFQCTNSGLHKLAKQADFGNRLGTGRRFMYNLLFLLVIQKNDPH
jgi:hypothetical protein